MEGMPVGRGSGDTQAFEFLEVGLCDHHRFFYLVQYQGQQRYPQNEYGMLTTMRPLTGFFIW